MCLESTEVLGHVEGVRVEVSNLLLSPEPCEMLRVSLFSPVPVLAFAMLGGGLPQTWTKLQTAFNRLQPPSTAFNRLQPQLTPKGKRSMGCKDWLPGLK